MRTHTSASTLPEPGAETRREIAALLAAGYLRLAQERVEAARMSTEAADVPEAQKDTGIAEDSP